jgi:hypothetical protein
VNIGRISRSFINLRSSSLHEEQDIEKGNLDRFNKGREDLDQARGRSVACRALVTLADKQGRPSQVIVICLKHEDRREAIEVSLPNRCHFKGSDNAQQLPDREERASHPPAGTGAHLGEFWWGLGASLGPEVEAKAKQNRGTLPALFSKSNTTTKTPPKQVRIWEKWRSVLSPRMDGRIPDHVIVTSGYNPNPKNKRGDNHYALVCHSNVKLALGSHGFCNLAHCLTVPNGKTVKYLVGARLLEKLQPPLTTPHGIASPSCRSIAFEANLIGHCYVKLEKFRVLTQIELDGLSQYKASDDWWSLAKSLRSPH